MQRAAPRSGLPPRFALRRRAAWTGVAAGLAALTLYAVTGARGAEWQDSGIHQYRILTGRLEHPAGLALVHPLHYWLGRMALAVPVGDPLHRLNLLSGVAGAVGVGVLAGLVTRLTVRASAGLFAGATLAVAHSYWQMSAITETYTVAAALLTIEWALLAAYVRTTRLRWLVAVFAVNGLHTADHLLGLLSLATYGVLLIEGVVRRRVPPGWVAACAVAWMAGAAPYWVLVVQAGAASGEWVATMRSALFGGGTGSPGWEAAVLNVHPTGRQLLMALLALGYCFPSAALPLGVYGLMRRVTSRRRLWRRVLRAQTVIIVVFVARYSIKDVYTYFVPVCAVVALWVGIGAGALLRPRQRRSASSPPIRGRSAGAGQGRRLGPGNREPGTGNRGPRPALVLAVLLLNVALPPAMYAAFPRLAEARGWLRGQMRDVPLRNEYDYLLQPWRAGANSPRALAAAAFDAAGDDGWVLADSTTAFAIALLRPEPAGGQDRGRRATDGPRVFWLRHDLTRPDWPVLSDEELLGHAARGGRIIAIPAREIEAQVPEGLVLLRDPPLWRVTLPGGP